jgi:putative heme-binding domain-containing protein
MLTTLLVAALLAQNGSAAAQPDMARAKRLFDTGCAGCHGPEGVGGKGPSLAVPKLRHAKTDGEIVQLILTGIPGTEMPPSWYLGGEVALVAAYVRQLGANATPPKVEGDVAKGKALFEGKGGCANCHTIGAAGHAYGPDLSDIGARRTAASLRESLTNPSAEIAPEYMQVHVVTRQGEQVTGIRINEDSFTIQILEPSGRFQSFRKADLSTLEKRADQSPMPSYQRVFSDAELQDLIAYLSSLRGEQ